MRVLVLGGTEFVGRAIVEDLLDRDHDVTLFNRGRSGGDLFPAAERLVGDRDIGDYATLAGRRWHAVVDTCGYVPRHIAEAIDALADHSGRYLFMSTGMVYDHLASTGEITEQSARLPPHRVYENDDHYGALKVACEDDLLAHFGERLSIVRPGWVVGPHDPTDRFTYWVRRCARPGRVLAPGRLDRPMQVVDVRDLARLAVLLLEKDRPGAYNCVGPTPAITLEQLIRACGAGSLVSVPDGTFRFPLLLPDPSWDPLLRIDAAAARACGMPQTPLAQSVADVLAWDRQRGEPPLATGPSEEEEGEFWTQYVD